jgi:hypothetical protein
MQDPHSSRSLKSDVAIGAIIGVGLFGTALACGIITFPLAIPIGIGAVLAGAILFPTIIKPTIQTFVNYTKTPKMHIQNSFGSVNLSQSSLEDLEKEVPPIKPRTR